MSRGCDGLPVYSFTLFGNISDICKSARIKIQKEQVLFADQFI